MGIVAGLYHCKQCVQEAIQEWWPDRKSIAGPDFMPSMRSLQADMIRCHFEQMSDEDRERAVRTLMWLETEQ